MARGSVRKKDSNSGRTHGGRYGFAEWHRVSAVERNQWWRSASEAASQSARIPWWPAFCAHAPVSGATRAHGESCRSGNAWISGASAQGPGFAEGCRCGAWSQRGGGNSCAHRMGAVGGGVRRGDRVCNRLVQLAAASSGLNAPAPVLTSRELKVVNAIVPLRASRVAHPNNSPTNP